MKNVFLNTNLKMGVTSNGVLSQRETNRSSAMYGSVNQSPILVNAANGSVLIEDEMQMSPTDSPTIAKRTKFSDGFSSMKFSVVNNNGNSIKEEREDQEMSM